MLLDYSRLTQQAALQYYRSSKETSSGSVLKVCRKGSFIVKELLYEASGDRDTYVWAVCLTGSCTVKNRPVASGRIILLKAQGRPVGASGTGMWTDITWKASNKARVHVYDNVIIVTESHGVKYVFLV